jgi:hypothetical protein
MYSAAPQDNGMDFPISSELRSYRLKTEREQYRERNSFPNFSPDRRIQTLAIERRRDSLLREIHGEHYIAEARQATITLGGMYEAAKLYAQGGFELAKLTYDLTVGISTVGMFLPKDYREASQQRLKNLVSGVYNFAKDIPGQSSRYFENSYRDFAVNYNTGNDFAAGQSVGGYTLAVISLPSAVIQLESLGYFLGRATYNASRTAANAGRGLMGMGSVFEEGYATNSFGQFGKMAKDVVRYTPESLIPELSRPFQLYSTEMSLGRRMEEVSLALGKDTGLGGIIPEIALPTRVPIEEIIKTQQKITWNKFRYGDRLEFVDGRQIKYSQSSINDVKDLVVKFQEYGWEGPPINVVRTLEGSLITMDNTRLYVTNKLKIPAQIIVRESSESLPCILGERFMTRRGGIPTTWGEAVEFRINNQNSRFRNENPLGSFNIHAKE